MTTTPPKIRVAFYLFSSVAFLLGLIVWLYLPAVGNPLVFDDKPFFGGNYVARCASEIHLLHGRFLWCASFAHQFMLQGENYGAFRWVNIGLHIAAATTLSVFATLLLQIAFPERKKLAPLASLMAATVFALHPAHVYAVAYLVERSIVMATLGALIVSIAWLRAMVTGKRQWLMVVVLAYYFSIYSKEHAVLILIIPVSLSILLRRQYPLWKSDLAITFLLCFSLGVYAAYLGRGTVGQLYEPMGNQVLLDAVGPNIHLRSVLTQCGLFFKYVSIWLFPDALRMSVDMRESLVPNIYAPSALLSAIAYAAWGLIAFVLLLCRGGKGLFGFGLLIPWVLFGTELATVRAQEIFVLYRGYLWFFTLVVPLAWLLSVGLTGRVGRWLLLACWVSALTFCFTQTRDRIQTFSSSYLLWNDAVRLIEIQPTAPMFAERAYNNRGHANLDEGKCTEALPDIDHALRLNPRLCPIHSNRAKCLLQLKRPYEAVTSYDRAIGICPQDASSYYGRYVAKTMIGDQIAARTDLARACELGMNWACAVAEQTKKNGDILPTFDVPIAPSAEISR